jgi:hypothetical protein
MCPSISLLIINAAANFGAQRTGSIAVLQLLYTEATAAERLFPQEKDTLHDLKRATSIGELH